MLLWYRVVKMVMDIVLSDEKANVMNKKRFMDEFTGNEIVMPKKKPRPEDYEETFAGNTDDTFRIGITITKKSVKVSDIIK
jgi:U3 small nucleolar RNA-associated protein 25